jgi:hypothetical protein
MFLDCYSENDPCSFPLSSRLIQEKTKLGRNARMLAVQSFERNKADQVRLFEFVRKKKNLFFLSFIKTLNAGLWYRALMQVILVEVYGLTSGLEDIKLGKLNRKPLTFEEYVWKALEKLKLDKTKVYPSLASECECFFFMFD